VNDGVKMAEPVHLFGNIASGLDARQVTGDNGLCARDPGSSHFGSLCVAGVEDHFVARGDHEPGSHLPETVG
jgi:hypothetical protein